MAASYPVIFQHSGRRSIMLPSPSGQFAIMYYEVRQTTAVSFTIYKGYLAQERGMIELRLWIRQLHDVATAVARGDRDVWKIQSEEHGIGLFDRSSDSDNIEVIHLHLPTRS